MRLVLKATHLRAPAIKDTGLAIVNVNSIGSSYKSKFKASRFFATYAINGTNYSNVQVITRDTVKDHTNEIF